MILAPPCGSPTLLVSRLNHLFPSHDFLHNSYSNSNNCSWTVSTKASLNHIPSAFPRISLSTPPISNKNVESQILFCKQLQRVCLSALPDPSLETRSSKNNSKSRFLSLALPNSYNDDEPHIKEDKEEEEEEDKATASSALQKEEEVPAGVSLPPALELWAQLTFTHVATSTEDYMRALTGLMSTRAEIRMFDCLQLCTFYSAIAAIQRYAYLKKPNGASKSSPQLKGASSPMTHFYPGVMWSFAGTCLAIMALRRSVYSLKIYQEVGFSSLIQSILKSLTPGSVMSSYESWPLKVSAFYILSNLWGLVCSLRCYDQRESIQLQEVAKQLYLMSLPLLGYVVGSLHTWLRTLGRI